MKKTRDLTLAVLVFMLVVPSLVLLGSNPSATDFDATKKYTESYDHHDQIWIQSDAEFHAQAAAESWAGDGTAESPYVITGYLFDCESQPLRIWHTRVHWIFTDNEIFGVGDNIQCGSWIENVTNGAIVNNEVHNRHSALAISAVSEFRVADNYIHDCWGNGIEFFGHMNDTIIQDNIVDSVEGAGIYSVTSRDCIVQDNTISNIDNIGIALLGTSPDCTVTRNTITHCELSGIMMAQTSGGFVTDNIISHVEDQGIYMAKPENCEISNNTIRNVDGVGMRMSNSDFTDIFENEIADCTEDGFRLGSGTNTTVHWNSVTNVSEYAVNLESLSANYSVKYNTFIDNGVTCQICDDGTSNIVSHNFYNDWSSPDANADGFVDSPYAFEGDSATQDEFPLAEAGIVPTTETTTTTGTENQLPMELILIAGAVGAIVVVASVLMLKRR
ncbi:MAG: right-handed parallel beta-helix repeat-containing protein [Candidatus Thorarchaeota archaeon]